MAENLIIGAGAIGTVFAAYLGAARQQVRVAVLPEELDGISHCEHTQIDRITGRPPLISPKPKLTTSPVPRAGENVFICVKHRDFGPLLDSLPEDLPEGVTLIPCLNGVGASRMLAERFPNHRVVGLTIMFNAQLLEPLHARVTARPQILLNTDDRALLGLFGQSGLDVRRAAGAAEAYGKLLINLANAICALTNTTFKDLLTQQDLTASFVMVMDEAVAVLRKSGIRFKMPVALPYAAYRLMLLHGGPLPWWVGRMRNHMSEGSYPSMVWDLRRGYTTEVRQLNGEIVQMAKTSDLQAPCNAKLVELIEAHEGQPPQSYMSAAELRATLERVKA